MIDICSHNDYIAIISDIEPAMQLTIRMPDEYRPQLERLVKQMGLKKSDVIRMAIKEFIINHTGTEEYPYSKAKRLIGVADSGIDDLGRNHRKHLLARIKSGAG